MERGGDGVPDTLLEMEGEVEGEVEMEEEGEEEGERVGEWEVVGDTVGVGLLVLYPDSVLCGVRVGVPPTWDAVDETVGVSCRGEVETEGESEGKEEALGLPVPNIGDLVAETHLEAMADLERPEVRLALERGAVDRVVEWLEVGLRVPLGEGAPRRPEVREGEGEGEGERV